MEDENFDVIDPAIQINVNQSRKDVKNMARNIALNEDPNKGTTWREYAMGNVSFSGPKRKQRLFDRIYSQYAPSQISQGKTYIGGHADFAGRKSLFGKRRLRDTQPIGARWINRVTDKLRLTSPPTYTDGYGTSRNAEVRYPESAQGQQDAKMAESLGKLGLATSLGVDPVTTIASLATGVGSMYGAKKYMDAINNYNIYGFQIDPELQRKIEFGAGLLGGGFTARRLGTKVPVEFDDRAFGGFLRNDALRDELINSEYTPTKGQLLGDDIAQFFRKTFSRKPGRGIRKNPTSIGHGSETEVFDIGRDVMKVKKTPFDQYGGRNYSGTTDKGAAIQQAAEIAKEDSRGIYKPKTAVLEPYVDSYGNYVPTIAQEKMIPANDVDPSTININELTRFLVNNQKGRRYDDLHFGNIAFDTKGHPWVIDGTKGSNIFKGVLMPRQFFKNMYNLKQISFPFRFNARSSSNSARTNPISALLRSVFRKSNRTMPMSPTTVNKSPMMFKILPDGRIHRFNTEPMIKSASSDWVGKWLAENPIIKSNPSISSQNLYNFPNFNNV